MDPIPVAKDEARMDQYVHMPPSNCVKEEEAIWRLNERIWMPNNAERLKLRIAVVGHCGGKRRQTFAATLEMICKSYR